MSIKKWLPWLFFALFAADIAAILVPKKGKPGEFNVPDFGRLPVLLNGRVQPLDSVGRNTLRQLRGTQDVPLEVVPSWKFWHHPKKLRGSAWILEAMCRPDEADNRPVFLIHHPELLAELHLENKGIERSGLRYYTFNEIRPSLDLIQNQVQELFKEERQTGRDPQSRTTYQKQLMKLNNALYVYRGIKNSLEPEDATNFLAQIDELQQATTNVIPAGLRAAQAQRAGQDFNEADLTAFAKLAEPFYQLSQRSEVLMVPPHNRASNPNSWATMGDSLLDVVRGDQLQPATRYYATMANAYRQGDIARFNGTVSQYHQWLEAHQFHKELSKGASEFYFNNMQPFLHAIIIYIFAFLLACGALAGISLWPSMAEALRRSAWWLVALAFVVHTAGLVFRMVLEGRPPVTNLYSSAIFIGWGATVLGFGLERFFKVGLGLAVASCTGFITLIIAQNLAIGGDTMEMMRAVLDSNFWLATHVVVITIGYASTFVAGALAIAYVVLGVFTPLLRRKVGEMEAGAATAPRAVTGRVAAAGPTGKAVGSAAGRQGLTVGQALTKMVYGIVCFATLFSFVGTVLGGIWADQSWGRFWGWDPKENGALIIVLWNAIILHARWGGLIRERGLMNLAIFGNIVTAFSWFGVNMLGIGLHSYGFMDEAFKWLMIFNASQVCLIGLGLLPLSLWSSFREKSPPSLNRVEPALVGK